MLYVLKPAPIIYIVLNLILLLFSIKDVDSNGNFVGFFVFFFCFPWIFNHVDLIVIERALLTEKTKKVRHGRELFED